MESSVWSRIVINSVTTRVAGRFIALGWDGAALVTDTGMRWLKIPRKLLDAVSLDLIDVPIELDYRTETILRKVDGLLSISSAALGSAQQTRQPVARSGGGTGGPGRFTPGLSQNRT